MRTVHKYTLDIDDAFDAPKIITWHKGAKILHVGSKTCGHIDFWVEVDQEVDEYESRAFRVYATGAEIHSDAEHVATSVQSKTDNLGFTSTLVWHVYEHQI